MGPDSAIIDLVRRVQDAAASTDRYLLGIAGSPGSGKTTLAVRLVHALNAQAEGTEAVAVHVPMDGYHLANTTLDRLGSLGRKGAIDTFDGWGYVALLRRLRAETADTVYAPSFDRRVDEGVAGAIAVEPGHRIVVTEGNYLLADVEPWTRVRDALDAAWFCATPASDRESRLVARHTRHGRSTDDATAWARDVDGANAVLIEASRARADLVVSGVDGRVLGDRVLDGGMLDGGPLT